MLAEQLSAAGVPMFAADIKGDLTGVATPGPSSDKLLARTTDIGQDWKPASFPTEYFSLGGLSSATVGVILRNLIAFGDQGADVFFGEPEIDTAEFMRTTADGRGVISLLEVPGVQDKPALFSTFLMWLLADLFNDLPEVGDIDKPKLVFFFDEANLLFQDASKDFLAAII